MAAPYKDYAAIVAGISEKVKSLRTDIPEVMQGFDLMAKSATKGGTLDEKTKEFIALAIGVAARCDGCIGFHVKALVRLHTTRQELEEVLAMAVYMGGGPSLMYAADALRAFEQFSATA